MSIDKIEKIYTEGFEDGQNQATENMFIILEKIFQSINSLQTGMEAITNELDRLKNKVPDFNDVSEDYKMNLTSGEIPLL